MIQGSEETGDDAAVESGHGPSPLLGLMANFRAQIGVQLSKDVEDGRHPRSYEDSNENMQTIIDILLDQNEQLITCLAELENEAEKRTQQMQKRLHSTADVTRATVYKMCAWGEEIQSIVSKRHLAEEAAYESKRMVAELQKENSQLRNYNDNLYSDIQSLLSIINVARTTGNWEMDCVTFCVISPEEVYGPICRLSSQHADGVTTLDLKPDPLLQGPETEETGAATGAPSKVGGKNTSCRTKFSTNTPEVCGEAEVSLSKSLPLLCATMQDSMNDHGRSDKLLIQQKSRSYERPILFASWKRRGRKMRKSLTLSMSKRKLSAPVHNSHFGHNMATVATTASRDRLYHCPAEYDVIQTEASDTSFEVMRTHTDQWPSGGILNENFIVSAVQEGPLKMDKRSPTIMTTTKPVAEWEQQSNLSASLPALSSVWEESMVIQGTQNSAESFLLSSWKKKCKNVRRRLDFNTSKKLYAPKQHSHNEHLVATMVNRKDVDDKNFTEVSTQTHGVDPTYGEKSTQTDLPSTYKKHDQSDGSLPLHHKLLQTDDANKSTVIMGTQTDVEWEICPPSGNEQRDQELRSLKDRLNLAVHNAQSKALLSLELQTLLDVSTKEVEFRDQVLKNLETKLTNSRQETDNLKEELLHVKIELEFAKQTAEKERVENERLKAEVKRLSQTVTYLQDALVELKKIKAQSSAASLPRVHDV
ncbi:uncharacterized protein LOC119464960 isoform X3 [Dermacentor silvarum]|nr:uncharacterized protein LOC119464960 isoform X3 [Dermacentor silvarum]XP_049524994.1 uncharacterized protein LOC119464960 isoform X3 [Dermacentor silvarum]XP_049525000.1 uncharacterized protein LOC119464960 isoform X3 [Dermacentor silvarum]XP_049525006.1 uncharacterized protein LOC119464960 isoform X3 [Dermacentor silvarum]